MSQNSFIPKPQRILAIIQLCLAFTVIAGALIQPFVSEYFAYKSNESLYNAIARNSHRFQQLPQEQQQSIAKNAQALQKYFSTPFLEKAKKGVHLLTMELPPFQKAWIALAIVVSIMLLLKVEGAKHAAWLLPFVTVCYGFSNVWPASHSESQTTESALFPSETFLVQEYLKRPLSPYLPQQKEELTHAWHLYLIDRWVKETPSASPADFQNQVAKGELAFNIARLEARAADISSPEGKNSPKKESFLLIIAYFFWNLFFAGFVNFGRPRQLV